MKTARQILEQINVSTANLDHIMKTGTINGSLLVDIEKAMEEYKSQSQPLPIEGVEREWISVEKRLPKEMQEVLFCNTDIKDLKGNIVQTTAHCGYFANNGNFYSWLDHQDRFNPTHWMPLPSPPKNG